jgi:hypothetical protein
VHVHTAMVHVHTAMVHVHTAMVHVHTAVVHVHTAMVHVHTAMVHVHTAMVHVHTAVQRPAPPSSPPAAGGLAPPPQLRHHLLQRALQACALQQQPAAQLPAASWQLPRQLPAPACAAEAMPWQGVSAVGGWGVGVGWGGMAGLVHTAYRLCQSKGVPDGAVQHVPDGAVQHVPAWQGCTTVGPAAGLVGTQPGASGLQPDPGHTTYHSHKLGKRQPVVPA